MVKLAHFCTRKKLLAPEARLPAGAGGQQHTPDPHMNTQRLIVFPALQSTQSFQPQMEAWLFPSAEPTKLSGKELAALLVFLCFEGAREEEEAFDRSLVYATIWPGGEKLPQASRTVCHFQTASTPGGNSHRRFEREGSLKRLATSEPGLNAS